MPRFHLLTRVDIAVASSGELYWGSMLDLSRTGVSVVLRRHLEMNQRTTVRFHFQSLDGKEVVEELIAKVVWQRGDNTGLEFETPLTAGAPALKAARFLVTHIEAKEAGH
jgi:hypothetical protein